MTFDPSLPVCPHEGCTLLYVHGHGTMARYRPAAFDDAPGYSTSTNEAGPMRRAIVLPPETISPAAVRRGQTFMWSAMVKPPEGYRFLPARGVYFFDHPLPIVALSDHDDPPVLPDWYVREISSRPDKQAKVARGG